MQSNLSIRALTLAYDVLPMEVLIVLFLLLSYFPIMPQSLAASVRFLPGVLTGNLVFDGWNNTPYIILASLVAISTSLLFPRFARRYMSWLFLLTAFVGASLSLVVALTGSDILAHYCISNCTFSGMSTVAAASVGAAFAYSLFALVVLMAANVKRALFPGLVRVNARRVLISFTIFLLALILLLLLIIVALGNVDMPVLIAHSASLIFGLVLGLVSSVIVLWKLTIQVRISRDM